MNRWISPQIARELASRLRLKRVIVISLLDMRKSTHARKEVISPQKDASVP